MLGTENGNVLKINTIDDSREVKNVGNNRVYDIITEEDTVLWVGIRNEGVKRISSIEKKYYIPHPTDTTSNTTDAITDSYAVYHIQKDGDTIYFATSSGIYKLNRNDWEQDTVLHQYYRPSDHSLYHFGVNQVFINDRYIYAATSDSGLVVMNRYDSSIHKKLTTTKILHFHNKCNDSILYASSNDSIYKINVKLPMVQQNAIPIKNDCHNIFAYIVDSLGGEWTLTSTEMKYKHGKESASFLLPNKLSTSYKNYICKTKYFILVSCHNSLYAFSLHQNPLSKSNNVIAACTKKTNDSEYCYFITHNNELYAFKGSESKAKPIGNLSLIKGEKPVKLYAGTKYLWLISNNSLFKIDPENIAEASREIGITHSDAKKKLGGTIDFRSIYENDDLLFLGTRNYLLRFNKTTHKIDSIPTTVKSKVDFSDLYITDIIEIDSEKYFATLKHGIFKLKVDSLDKQHGSDTIGEIRKFINCGNGKILLYTSKGVHEQDTDTTFYRYPKINSKTILTICYGHSQSHFIGYKGIESKNLNETSILNSIDRNLDISVNEAAIAEITGGHYLYIGSESGFYKFENNELTSIGIQKDHKVYVLLSVVIFAAMIVVLFFFYRYQKKRSPKNRLEFPEIELSDPLKTKIKHLEKIVNKETSEETSEEIKTLCEEILKSHEDISSVVSKLSCLNSSKSNNSSDSNNSSNLNRSSWADAGKYKRHVPILYFIKNIKPQKITKSAPYLKRKPDDPIFHEEIAKLKHTMWKQLGELLIKEKELQNNSVICYLYNRIKGRDKINTK
jgi:hypothetical protein